MDAMKTEVEPLPETLLDGQSNRESDRESVKPAGEPEHRHFSPDPMGRTDRYRLVTPYRLPPLEV